jgi:carboxyl-terminal processing protease
MRNPALMLLGAAIGVAFTLAATEPQLVFTGADARPAPATKKHQLLGLFVGAFEQVRFHYVEKPDDTKLIHSAIDGMLSSLDASSFIDAKSALLQACAGSGCPLRSGAGLELTMVDGLIEVVSPLDDGPAAKAGIMSRDIIAEIDDQPVENLPLNDVYAKLKGERGQQIRLKITRPGREMPINVAFARDIVPSRSVRTRVDGGDIGYIRISQFNDATTQDLNNALDEITRQIAAEQFKGFVVDLRNNPWGQLESAVAVADAFLDSGEIVSIRGRKTSANEHFLAKPGDLTDGKPIIVLINAGSAAAAEIVAGALKDNHRAMLVGSRSFGKGSVQTVVSIGPGLGALSLTTGHYVTPSGRVITGNGILPDVEVLQDMPEALAADTKTKEVGSAAFQSYIPPDPKADKALTAALDMLRAPKTAR